MRKTRIHVDAALTSGQTIRLPEEIARHLVAVLRLRPGDPCWLFRGDGVDYRAELLEADKRGVVAMIHEASATPPASPLSITLIQGIARGEKMDLILQKATELGVDVLAPVFSQRSEVRLTGERLDKRMQHWQGVVRGACEQSGRGTMPRLLPACDLAQRMAETQGDDGLRVRLEPKAESGLTDIASNPPRW